MKRALTLLSLGALFMVASCGDDEPSGPSHDASTDYQAVQAIIDANGLTGLAYPGDVALTDQSSGRTTDLLLDSAHLDGRHGLVDTLPPELGELTALKRLLFENTNVSSIPSTIGGCGGLTYLVATGNQLTALPDQLFTIRSLTSVTVDSNQIGALQEAVGQLTGLLSLNVASNNLTALPNALASMTSLQSLIFDDNAVCSITPEMLAKLTSLGYSANWLAETYQRCP